MWCPLQIALLFTTESHQITKISRSVKNLNFIPILIIHINKMLLIQGGSLLAGPPIK